MLASIQHWEEWHARCALLRCGEETRTALRGFAWTRFVHYAQAALGESGVQPQVPAAEDCWHLLESDLSVARPRSGRRYKEWLFARLEGTGDAPIDVIQGGASLLMRTVVRTWALHETTPRKTRSMDAPLCLGASGLTLADLLPAEEGTSLEDDELAARAATLAPAFFDTLDPKARLVLLAKHLDLPLYDPGVLALAGIGRSRASDIWRSAFTQLAGLVGQTHPTEPRDWQLKLTLVVARLLNERIVCWGRVEKTAQPLFFMAERNGGDGKAGRRQGALS